MNKNQIDIVIYHNPCPDGFLSATIVNYYYKITNNQRNIKYFRASYYNNPPNVKGLNVLICDFSFKKDILKKMINDANSLLVIDHHKTAIEDLLDIDNKHKIFNMDHSGCMLTWNYFFNGKEPPMLVKYVENIDLWKKNLPSIEEFYAWFYQEDLVFDNYLKYLNNDVLTNGINTNGTLMLKYKNNLIKDAVKPTSIKLVKIKDNYFIVSFLNSNIFKSEIGNKINHGKYDMIDFSCVYSFTESIKSYNISLRSMFKKVDVSKIASYFGGGGHYCASGLKCKKKPFFEKEIEISDIYYQIKNSDFKNNIVKIIIPSNFFNRTDLENYLKQKVEIKKDDKIETVNKITALRYYLTNEIIPTKIIIT